MKVEIVKLRGNEFTQHACTQKQLDYIGTLCKAKGYYDEYRKYLLSNVGWKNRGNITITTASKLITALKANEEIEFVIYTPTEIKEIKSEFKPILPQAKFNSVPKTSLEDMEAKLKKLTDDSNS